MNCPRRQTLELVASLPPVTLAELEERARLTSRHDHKYLATWDQAHRLLAALTEDHGALEIDGRRSFTYDTVYFDSTDLMTYRAHVQDRRRRFKVRVRSYVDADQHVLELKLKGRRGETIKHRSHCPDIGRPLSPAALEFLDGRLQDAYGTSLPTDLHPVLRTRYRRMTLVQLDGLSRLTCDWQLDYPYDDHDGPALSADHVILELKAQRARAPAIDTLRALGVRPTGLSKYVLGVGLRDIAPLPGPLRRTARTLFPELEAPARVR